MNSRILKYYLLIVTGCLMCQSKVMAIEEPYMNELRGAQVAVNNFFTVADEKFNTTASALIQQNISVNNIISFEINFDTSIYFYNQPFECTINFKIYLYNNINDTSDITDSTTHSNISLQVRYDTVTGKPYKGIAMYKFTNARKYRVKILSITSPQLSPIPAIFRLKGQIIIDRKYNFQDNSTDVTRYSIINSNQLKLEWTPSNYPGAEMFDLEYTHIDGGSQIAASIRTYGSAGSYTVPVDSLTKWFTNNGTRITTTAAGYLFNIPYDSGFILFRIRGVQIHYPDNIRWEGNWNCLATATNCTGSGCSSGVVFFNPHESNLNWQYTVSFAEEGKRKEVISYYDGTLRNRQSVTINNSDNKNIVQETIYDALGRPSLNILPAPTKDSTIHYFRRFNNNGSGNPYSFTDLLYNCRTHAAALSSDSGAGRYYSPNNPFLADFYYAKYIPDAEGFPFAVSEYMADNTGRMKAQGGVGPTFQLDSGHATRYFYGKPTQIELDRLFGTEAGNASHYLKNMVVDPNGQISVSYVNAGGKTIATALAGSAPTNLHALPSTAGASTQVTDDLMQPDDFERNSADYSVSASATFLAPVTGSYVLKYRVDPLRMEKLYGPNKDSVICNNCYYDLLITVKDDCNNIIRQETRPAGTVFDTACANPPGIIQDTVGVNIASIGEYYVSYRLVVSRDALNFYDSTHLVRNSDIKKLNYFLLEELKQADFFGCYSQCETCMDALGTRAEFTQRFKNFYTADSVYFSIDDSLFVLSLYDSLYNHCASIQSTCAGNVCDEKLELLKLDVRPGGQYAPYDTTNNALLETTINVLNKRGQIVLFTDAFGNRDSVQLYKVNGEDSVKLDVKSLNDSMFIANWRDEWADSLVRLHPEYCMYLWCVANSNSFEFDKQIEDLINADTAIAQGWFNPNAYDAILAHDPFFLPGGNGVAFQNRMRDSLRLFSRTFARGSMPDRNILQFIDITLYCKDQANGWESCNPDSACRSRNREWFLYQHLYLNLKQHFYEEARRTSSNPVFANCVNCFIGKDMLATADMVCRPAPSSDFSFDTTTVTGPGGIIFPVDPALIYKNKTAVLRHPLTIFVRRFNTYPWINPFYDTISVVMPAGENYLQLPVPNAEQHYVGIISSTCDTVPHIPFDDSSNCNYACPTGVYNPYDRDNISLHIEYGNPNTPPSGAPNGYGNCQFYNSYLLQTGANTSCRFFNVWVCTYDSTCGGVCAPVVRYPSQCTDNPDIELYKNKVRRYPEYVNGDEFIEGVLNGNVQQNSIDYSGTALDECRAGCEAQADIWINQLRGCTQDSATLANLKQALINICSAGCSEDRPFGASTIPASIFGFYHSFEEAIVSILGPNAINDSCTAELLASPYPYDRQPVYAQRIIHETNYEICQKIGQFKTAWQSSGFAGPFHNYLVQTLGGGYDLDPEELDDLLNACINCNGILKDDIVLPAAFEPGSAPCLMCDSVQAALTAFNNKFPNVETTADQYESLFANFFNHRFGYALTYDQYRTYLDSCTAHPSSYMVKLCNRPVTQEATIDNNNDDCMASLYATALTNAGNTYIAYIDSVRRDFREAYMTRCLNVQPALTMSAELFEYHYTLYYYDQSGNLVKTIPPEGVALLNNDSIELVKLHRKLQSEGCYQYSDSIHFNNNGQINWTIVDTFEARNYTAEMMLNLDAYANQVLVSKLAEHMYDTSGGVSQFYRHTGFIVKVEGNKLRAEVYGIGRDTLQRQAIGVSVLDAPSIIPLHKWTHYVVQRSRDPLSPVRLWVNGNPVALQFTTNDIDSSVILGGTANLVVSTHNAAHLPMPGKLQGTIKNLRIYNRLLMPAEIRQNTYNNCQTPASRIGLFFWSVMNNAKDNLVKDVVTQQNGVLTGFTWQPFNGVFPVHRLPTVYAYNSLNEVLQKYSPDGDTAQFFYDRLGRLIASQNKEQKDNDSYSGTANRFSYTKYDVLGRLIETGEKSSPVEDVRNINLLDSTAARNWLASGIDRQVTKSLYDNPVNPVQVTTTSRKRLVASIYLENASDMEGDSTLYSYDIVGNVNTVVQHIKALVAIDATNGKKRIDYEYDLVSGKVNQISYQQGRGDQFFYKNGYDADNRIVRVYSSRDKLVWNEEADYLYYLHGPLARMELGHLKVQGTDYSYTLQEWLKGINGDALNAAIEMGGDGQPNSTFSRVSKDVYGLKLGFHNDDYKPVGGSSAAAFDQHNYTAPGSLAASGNQMFNGNISYTALALSRINNGNTTGYTYGYDQLNRLVQMRQHTVSGAWHNSNIIDAYSESIAYDANSNILQYLRRGANTAGRPLDMDSLNYKYNRDANGHLVNNMLNHVRDAIGNNNYTTDLNNQNSGNYQYDKTGNLIKDVSEGLDTVRWTMYGKINHIKKNSINMAVNYGYDATGNRTLKQVIGHDTTTNTYYVRDAQGNVLAVYEHLSVAANLKWSEQHLYGSRRLGMWQWNAAIPSSPPIVLNNNPVYDSLLYGIRKFELGNHLENVMAVISDKKIGFKLPSSTAVEFYIAEVLSQNDYYPLGMLMEGRSYTGSYNYRYGFNGKENDNEVKGDGGQQDYGLRIYDPRVGKFLSVDPLTSDYPWLTPYQFAAGNVISGTDLDGAEYFYAADGKFLGQGSDPKNTEVRLGAATGNGTYSPIDAKGNATKDWVVLHKDYETFKRILGTVYTETSVKNYNPAEAAGIYSVLRNRSGITKLEIDEELFVSTGVYGWKGLDGKIKETTKLVMAGKISTGDKKYRDVFAGLVNAITTGTDYSNGATTWHGSDFSTKGSLANRDYYLTGFQFTKASHDIYNMGDHPNNEFKLTGVINKEKIEINLRYKYISTGAAGGTIFMRRTYFGFTPEYPAIKQFYLKNRAVLSIRDLNIKTTELINKYVKGKARF